MANRKSNKALISQKFQENQSTLTKTTNQSTADQINGKTNSFLVEINENAKAYRFDVKIHDGNNFVLTKNTDE